MKVYSCNRHKVFKMGQPKTLDRPLQYFGTLKSWTKLVSNTWPFLLLEPILSVVTTEWLRALHTCPLLTSTRQSILKDGMLQWINTPSA